MLKLDCLQLCVALSSFVYKRVKTGGNETRFHPFQPFQPLFTRFNFHDVLRLFDDVLQVVHDVLQVVHDVLQVVHDVL